LIDNIFSNFRAPLRSIAVVAG